MLYSAQFDQNFESPKTSQISYDVVICGGGLAGITLARQLKLSQSDISILVIDRFTRPLPSNNFKVGESTVEIGTHYLTDVLDLRAYFNTTQVPKLGLRFFLGDSHKPLQERPEIGVSSFDSFHSNCTYHMDRTILESDLRKFNLELGINLLEGYSVQDIQISDGKGFHTITCKSLHSDNNLEFRAHWIIDATGRRRFLQKKLGLDKPQMDNNRDAVWFRMGERIDVSNLVPHSEIEWHARVPNNMRYYSANHLIGEGYWVWLLPLPTGCTSIGIVTSSTVHRFQDICTYEKALFWLKQHEPLLARYLEGKQPLDFMKMPRYSYSSTQVFSIRRWACVGEAGTFADPLYSPGTDLIAIANTLTAEMIRLDRQGKLTQKIVDHANHYYLQTNDSATITIGGSYILFGKSSGLFLAQFIWKAMYVWSTSTPLIFNDAFLSPERIEVFQDILDRLSSLSHRIEHLFKDWASAPSHNFSFEFIDYLGMMPFVNRLRSSLFIRKDDQQLFNDYEKNLKTLEELAQVLFLLALEDTQPEQLSRLNNPVWLNAWAVSLDISQWEHDGLFRPKSSPRDLNHLMQPIRQHLRLGSKLYSTGVNPESSLTVVGKPETVSVKSIRERI